MLKVRKIENGSKAYDWGKKALSRITATTLALALMLGGCGKAKAATQEKEYLFVKQPEVVGNYYYQFHWNDGNGDGLMEQKELVCNKTFIADPSVVLPQTDANVLAVSSEPVIYGWQNLGEYVQKDMGIFPTVDDAKKMIAGMQLDDGEKYVMRKLPEMINDGEAVRWYYWQDYDNDGKVDNQELVYYDVEVESPDVLPAQPNANVLAVSDVMFRDDWEVVGIYDEKEDSKLRDIDKVDKQIDKLVLIP